ncbi:MAG: flagellar hook-length control protein FliK [Hyphomonadaceae bacterium]|nr:flagellar hook-length control protein FliK [Hyphomonadaceae bacterium]
MAGTVAVTSTPTKPAVVKPAGQADAPEAAPATPITTDSVPVEQTAAPGAERAKAAANANTATPAEGSTTNASKVATQTSAGADAARTDLKVDVAAPSTNTSTTATDPLGAMRAPAGDTARAQATRPALQQAPAATIQVYTRMVERFDGRAQRFEVRLDPAELGRVDVRIEVGADKKVHAVLAAHDSAALTDLMRGQRSLERALTDAGFDLADGGVKFEMSGDNGRSLNGNQQQNGAWGSPEDAYVWRGFNSVEVAVETTTAELDQAARSYSRRPARLDLVA